MITIIGLVNSLHKFIANVVKDYRLTTSKNGNQELKAPRVVKYFLPPKDPKIGNLAIPDFPCVIIRPLTGTDDANQSIIRVKIIVGVYAEDHEGVEDALTILERIRLELYKQQIIDNKYSLEKPCSYEIPEEQPIPEWFVSMELNFATYNPFQEVNYG